MSEADKMFEELGYYKRGKEKNYLEYINEKDNVRISFMQGTVYIRENLNCNPTSIYASEIMAINKKCEELGWI